MSFNNNLSRRMFLRTSAALAASQSLVARAFPVATPILAYVGTYTGADGHGEGIYLYEMNPSTGALTNGKLVATSPSPSWITIHPSRRFLYAANELAKGTITAFAIDTASGQLQQINLVSSGGAGPCYLSIDSSGRFAFVANYGSGAAAVLPIHSDGSLGEATDIQQHAGNVGAAHATNAPAASFAISGHDGPHAHFILPAPQSSFVLATDLGQDRIYVYRLDATTGKFAEQSVASLPAGDGPRHIAFHPNGKWLYSIQEEASTVALFDFNSTTGSLTARQTISALPSGFAGTSYASEILIHPNGRWLYAANRLHDTVAVFSIATDGTLTHIGETATGGDYPVQCRIDPSGHFLFACNRKSDAITSFRIDWNTGPLTSTGLYTGVGSPASITFL